MKKYYYLENKILKVLHQIEKKELTLTTEIEPTHVFAGNVRYDVSNGWALIVFNDCNSFDYLDSIILPGNKIIKLFPKNNNPYWEDEIIMSKYDEVRYYRPTDKIIKKIYKIWN